MVVVAAAVASFSSAPDSECRRPGFVVAVEWNCCLLPDSGSGWEDSVVAGSAGFVVAGSVVVACR